MSYDGWIEMLDPDTGEEIELAEIGNYTSNVSGMWDWCLSAALTRNIRLKETNGWPCEGAYPAFTRAVELMEKNPSLLRLLEPDNDWGDYDGALVYLRKAAEVTRQFRNVPGAYVRWWT